MKGIVPDSLLQGLVDHLVPGAAAEDARLEAEHYASLAEAEEEKVSMCIHTYHDARACTIP